MAADAGPVLHDPDQARDQAGRQGVSDRSAPFPAGRTTGPGSPGQAPAACRAVRSSSRSQVSPHAARDVKKSWHLQSQMRSLQAKQRGEFPGPNLANCLKNNKTLPHALLEKSEALKRTSAAVPHDGCNWEFALPDKYRMASTTAYRDIKKYLDAVGSCPAQRIVLTRLFGTCQPKTRS